MSSNLQSRIDELTKKKAAIDSEEVQKVFRELSKWQALDGPLVPRFRDSQINPVNKESSLNLRLIVEGFAEAFQHEMSIVFDKQLGVQYTAFRSDDIYEARLLLVPSIRSDILDKDVPTVLEKENITNVFRVVGCCLFYRDVKLTDEKKTVSEWVGAFAWVYPKHRRRKILQTHWAEFSAYGEFWIEGPVSDEMRDFMKKMNISEERVLDCDRYKTSL